ncbi:hypothetical protein MNL06_06025 [Bartonella krasnovii]|uniref:hypothetical protein n=1 Tax=Bartonella krasnovii TaxID=2267275 RepID=UPI001F4D2C36|nr:hypothetical protein [Bartonella krasnovii]UNF45112.1 hypothetical protein MNL06_06025 [Bartonella krasnovii]
MAILSMENTSWGGEHKLEEETSWDEERARIGALMGEKRKQREGGENGMKGAWLL